MFFKSKREYAVSCTGTRDIGAVTNIQTLTESVHACNEIEAIAYILERFKRLNPDSNIVNIVVLI